jgi:6-phosphogluconolactonase
VTNVRTLPAAGEATILVVPDEAALAVEAARRTVEILAEAVDRRRVAHLALSGGSSAVLLYRELVAPKWRSAVDWKRVHLWWSDERFVPVDHPESNAGLAYRLLFAVAALAGESGEGAQGVDVSAGAVPNLPVDPGHVHPVEVEETLGDNAPVDLAAERYADELARLLPKAHSGVPMFDLILTGVGPDGHIMSIFPHSRALADDAPMVLGIPAPAHVEPHLPRVTLSARVLKVAGQVLVMAPGGAKADILAHVLGEKHEPSRWPAQAALLPNAVWLLDEEAAAHLGS